MVDSLVALIQTLNSLSPLAVIGLLAIIIYRMVYKQPTNRDFHKLTTNDLHELPQMAETLRRIEICMLENFAFIVARLGDERRNRP
ncbi:MAG: hypothetical protein EHM35_08650 [Planctomycetaceae bacterium]|nr:MAG: hypothetical protein EHM35_08650 [Planctomycetaceae bacterium]